MYPAFSCGLDGDRWPARVTRIGFPSFVRARGAVTKRSVPTQVLTICRAAFRSLLGVPDGGLGRRRSPVVLARGE